MHNISRLPEAYTYDVLYTHILLVVHICNSSISPLVYTYAMSLVLAIMPCVPQVQAEGMARVSWTYTYMYMYMLMYVYMHATLYIHICIQHTYDVYMYVWYVCTTYIHMCVTNAYVCICICLCIYSSEASRRYNPPLLYVRVICMYDIFIHIHDVYTIVHVYVYIVQRFRVPAAPPLDMPNIHIS